MKPRVNLRLDATLLARLETAAREQKTTKTEVLEDALRCHLDPDRSRSLENRLIQRMDEFESRLGRLSWAVDLGVETTGHFVLYWLTRTDPIPEGERETAHALGQRRFDYFINQIAKKLRRRRSLVAESLRWEQSRGCGIRHPCLLVQVPKGKRSGGVAGEQRMRDRPFDDARHRPQPCTVNELGLRIERSFQRRPFGGMPQGGLEREVELAHPLDRLHDFRSFRDGLLEPNARIGVVARKCNVDPGDRPVAEDRFVKFCHVA
jgi:hypothetical protein